MDLRSVFSIAQPKPDAVLRLHCFPDAGGGPTAFFFWIAPLAPGNRVRLDSMSRTRTQRHRFREEPLTSISDLVGGVAARMAEIKDRPFALYGHSLGGLVAFELARSLRRTGSQAPEHIFVGASRPPHMGPLPPTIHSLPEDEFVDVLRARYGGIPTAIYEDREVLNLFMAPLRADFTPTSCTACRRKLPSAYRLPPLQQRRITPRHHPSCRSGHGIRVWSSN